MNKYRWGLAFFIVILLLPGIDVLAQCPMCKMAAESNLKNGGTTGKGLNAGILYLLSMPYVVVGCMVYYWIRNKRKVQEINAFSSN